MPSILLSGDNCHTRSAMIPHRPPPGRRGNLQATRGGEAPGHCDRSAHLPTPLRLARLLRGATEHARRDCRTHESRSGTAAAVAAVGVPSAADGGSDRRSSSACGCVPRAQVRRQLSVRRGTVVSGDTTTTTHRGTHCRVTKVVHRGTGGDALLCGGRHAFHRKTCAGERFRDTLFTQG